MPKLYKIIAALVLVSFVTVPIAHANPSTYSTTAQTAAATTTISYMGPGTATTTLIYDSYAARPVIADKAALEVQLTASSTSSVLNIAYEYTNGASGLDCLNTPDSCDWYKDNLMVFVNATTSQAFQTSVPNSMNWTFASSSQGGASVASTSNRALKIFLVPTPARYIRAIFTSTGAALGVWAQFIPAKQAS